MNRFAVFVSSLLFSTCLSADDWPAFGGPDRNQVSREKSFQQCGEMMSPYGYGHWGVGLGYSGVVEVNGKAYTQGYSNGKNTLFCVAVESGKILWTHQYPCEKAPKYFQGGSRSTPAISDGILYLNSHQGDFYALDAENGKILWTKNLLKDFGGRRPDWGFSGSPLCIADKVIFETGSENGSLVALDAKSGEPRWRAGSYEAAYSSPMMRTRWQRRNISVQWIWTCVARFVRRQGVEEISAQDPVRNQCGSTH